MGSQRGTSHPGAGNPGSLFQSVKSVKSVVSNSPTPLPSATKIEFPDMIIVQKICGPAG
jgi:hypothetical protein